MNDETGTDFAALAAKLALSADYRVLRRLSAVTSYGSASASDNVKRALVVDVETTGLSFANDAIIELGAILFAYDSNTGRILDIVASESWLDDPGRPIPQDVVQLTGITDRDVQGKKLDEARLQELMKDVGLVIAHNASFDRPFVDRRLPWMADRHWGCSIQDIAWKACGIGSSKLDYVLYAHAQTFLDAHHRALDDCRATVHILATAFADGSSPLGQLLRNCRAARSRVSAIRSPFETKDLLRQRGYGWSGDQGTPPKTWCREIVTQDLESELAWLREHVYAGGAIEPQVDRVDLRSRYRA